MSNGIDVFISCASEDKQIAKKIYDSLEKIGHKPWLYFENIPPGSKWLTDQIMPALDKCTVALLLLSEDASRSYWCNLEHQLLLDRINNDESLKIFPIVVAPEKELKYIKKFSYLALFQFHDMSNRDNYEQRFELLLQEITTASSNVSILNRHTNGVASIVGEFNAPSFNQGNKNFHLKECDLVHNW